MKSVMSGVEIRGYLNKRTFVCKTIGVALTAGSGLSVGKMGPFVHISSAFAEMLTKIPIFRYLQKSKVCPHLSPGSTVLTLRTFQNMRMEVYGAAVSVGVAAAFGAPVGGEL